MIGKYCIILKFNLKEKFMKKLRDDINARMFYALKVSEVSKVPFLFISVPGMGKSTSVEMFAKIRGYELVMLRGNSTSESEVMGYDVVDAANPASKSTKHLRPSWYEQVMQNSAAGKKTLLFLDEITTAPEYVQSALLHLIFERKVGMEDIPEDTLIVSAGNYSQSLGNNFGLIPPLMNRFCIFNIIPTAKDLDIFLNEYSGSLVGHPKNKMEEIEKLLETIDGMSLSGISDEDYSKIGEYIENGIREQTKLLMNSGKKVIDLAVSDMQSLYQDTNNDAALKGFVTFRTLNYLKRVTIAAYKCFGKEGLTCPSYRLMVLGLCGIGLSRDSSSKNVIVTDVDKGYYDQIGMVIEEIEKLKNTAVPEYEKFFNIILGKTPSEDGTTFTPAEKSIVDNVRINSIMNKLSEASKDPKMSGISRPISADILSTIGSMVAYNVQMTLDGIRINTADMMKNPISAYSLEDITSLVIRWNYLNDLLEQSRSLVVDESLGYSDALVSEYDTVSRSVSKNHQKMKTILGLFKKNNSSEYSLLPEVRTTAIDMAKKSTY